MNWWNSPQLETRRSVSWWNCTLCNFKMQDDGSVEAAQRMGEHIESHESEDPEENERGFRKWLADGHPGVGLPDRKHTEEKLGVCLRWSA